MRRQVRAGYSLVEVVLALFLIMSAMAVGVPAVGGAVQEYRLRGAIQAMRGLLREARALAASRSRSVGIVFEDVEGEVVLSLHQDGNANGIRRSEARSGVDPSLRAPWNLSRSFPGVRWGSPPASSDEPGLPALRLGPSQILAFSPLGTSSSGSMFLSNQQGLVYGVVVLGTTGRTRVGRYRAGRWEPLP